MNYAEIKTCDVANGPGVRVSLFVSGCTPHCEGCFNKEAWNFDFGKLFTEKVIDEIIGYMEPDYIKGITTDEIRKIKRELIEVITKNGAKEKIPFDADIVSKASEFATEISKKEAECYVIIYDKTKKLLDSFERVALFAKENKEKDKKSPVKMRLSLDGITLSCVSENGDAKEDIAALVEGKELEIGFNPRYVIDALKVIEDTEICIEFTTSISPVLFKPVVSNEFTYVVLPTSKSLWSSLLASKAVTLNISSRSSIKSLS